MELLVIFAAVGWSILMLGVGQSLVTLDSFYNRYKDSPYCVHTTMTNVNNKVEYNRCFKVVEVLSEEPIVVQDKK